MAGKTITKVKLSTSAGEAATGKTVEMFHVTYNGTSWVKGASAGTFTEVSGTGEYYLDGPDTSDNYWVEVDGVAMRTTKGKFIAAADMKEDLDDKISSSDFSAHIAGTASKHEIASINGLTTALAAKAASSHSHSTYAEATTLATLRSEFDALALTLADFSMANLVTAVLDSGDNDLAKQVASILGVSVSMANLVRIELETATT